MSKNSPLTLGESLSKVFLPSCWGKSATNRPIECKYDEEAAEVMGGDGTQTEVVEKRGILFLFIGGRVGGFVDFILFDSICSVETRWCERLFHQGIIS